MYDDVRITLALTTMIANITPPQVPLFPILQRASQPQTAPPRMARRLQPAAAAAAIIGAFAIGIPLVAPGVVESVEARIARILQWTPPPVPPPPWLANKLRPRAATLADAQASVPFRIRPPVGLPHDVTSSSIAVSRSGVYDKVARTWQLGSEAVFFVYARSGHRAFTLLADQFDPRTGPPGQYMYEDTGRVRDGIPVLVRREKFAWRNGDQVLTAVAGAGITTGEIETIRNAMHGLPITAARTRAARDSGTIDKLYASP